MAHDTGAELPSGVNSSFFVMDAVCVASWWGEAGGVGCVGGRGERPLLEPAGRSLPWINRGWKMRERKVTCISGAQPRSVHITFSMFPEGRASIHTGPGSKVNRV